MYEPVQVPQPPASDDCLNGSETDRVIAYVLGPYGCLAGANPRTDFPSPEIPPAFEAF